MSRPGHWWYGTVEKLIQMYPDQLKKDGSDQAEIAYLAIHAALEETMKKIDGADRVKLITLFYMKKRYTLLGAADQIPISKSLAKRWKSEFVYLVAKKMHLL